MGDRVTLRRILLKLSGEALGGAAGSGLNPETLDDVASDIVDAHALGVQVGIVIGGGNFVRGAELAAAGTSRIVGDHIGMLATVMNALAFADVLTGKGLDAHVLSSVAVPSIAEGFSLARAQRLLDDGVVVLFAGGTGNPFFTTDTAACLRAIEIGAEVVLKATKVDGVYDADPAKHSGAARFEQLSFDEVLARELMVMDLTAVQLCREHDLPVLVFDMGAKGSLTKIVQGDKVGTRIQAS